MKQNKKNTITTDYIFFCCQAVCYLLIALLPLIVYAVPYDNPFASYSWYGGAESSLDLFLKAKGIVFPILATFTFLLACILLCGEKQQGQKLGKLCVEQILFGIYTLFCLLSYLFSDNKLLGLRGAIEQNETILVLLGYAIVGYSFSILIQKYDLFPTICRALGIGCFLLLIVSLFQFFSHDLLQYSWIQTFVLPASLRTTGLPLVLQSDVDMVHRVYATLYNPNYLGVYGTLVLPILLFFFGTRENNWEKVVFLVGLILLFCVLLASGSKTFFMVLLLQIILAGLFLVFRAKRYLPIAAILVGLAFAVFLAYTHFSGNQPVSQVKTALTADHITGSLGDIQIRENGVFINYGKYELCLTFSIKENDSWIQVSDQNGTETKYQVHSDGTFRSDMPELSEVYFYAGKMKERYVCVAMIEEIPWYFSNQEQGTGYVYLTPAGKEADIITAQTVLPGYERFASGRGYIWGRSIPLLKNNLLLGKGPETFLLQFPQNDYVAAVNAGYYNTIISRPHNAYLQIGIQTGVLSLLAYLLILMCYLLRTFHWLLKKKTWNRKDWGKAAIFLSVVGYSICMLAHDSLVVTAPFYWALLGCGIGLNQCNSSKENKPIS